MTFLVLSKSLYFYFTLTAMAQDSDCTGSGLHFSCIAEAPWCKRLFYSPGSWFTAEPHYLGFVPQGETSPSV